MAQTIIPPAGGAVEQLNVYENGTYTAAGKSFSPVVVDVKGYSHDAFTLKNYIQSDKGQEIDTGYLNTPNTRYEIVCSYNKDNTTPYYPYLFGVNNQFGILTKYSSNDGRIFFNSSYYQAHNMNQLVGHKLVAVLASNHCKIMDEMGIGVSYDFGCGREMSVSEVGTKLFGSSGDNAQRIVMRLYRFRIWEGSVLVHEYLPHKDGSDVACLKDTVTGTIKYNMTGTREFYYGTDSALENSKWLRAYEAYTSISGNASSSSVELKSGSTAHRIDIAPPYDLVPDGYFHEGDEFVIAFTMDAVSPRISVNMQNASNGTATSATGLMTVSNMNTYALTTGSDVVTFHITTSYCQTLYILAVAAGGNSSTSASGKITITGMKYNGTLIFGSVTPPSP